MVYVYFGFEVQKILCNFKHIFRKALYFPMKVNLILSFTFLFLEKQFYLTISWF